MRGRNNATAPYENVQKVVFNPDSIHVQGPDEGINWNVGFGSACRFYPPVLHLTLSLWPSSCFISSSSSRCSMLISWLMAHLSDLHGHWPNVRWAEISSHSLSTTITVLVKNVKLALNQLITCHHWLAAFLLFLLLTDLTNYLSDLGWPMSFQGWPWPPQATPQNRHWTALVTLVWYTAGWHQLKHAAGNNILQYKELEIPFGGWALWHESKKTRPFSWEPGVHFMYKCRAKP